jgi:Holliday junction resolvase-like predicted endonuclease
MKINIDKNIIRNNGYDLRAYDLITYIKLLLISERINSNDLLLDHNAFKNMVMISDNRTLKKSLNTLYDNGLLNSKCDRLPTKGALSITVNKIESNDTIEINNDIFKYLYDLKLIGLHIVFYLKSYLDDANYDYTKLIEYDKVCERMMINKDTVVTHMKLIKQNNEFSYLTDKKNFEGDNVYKEEDYTPPKRKVYNTKNLELKLEKQLVKQIESIENGMKYINRQVEIKDGRIDILARDKNNTLCIIELKVVSNEERLIFQCVYYPTQFNEKTRMITIAPAYDNKISTALNSLGVEMKRYSYINDQLVIL